MFKACQFWECFWQCFLPIFTLKTLSETLPNLTKLKNLNYLKKAAVVSNFCLIGKISHDFLVPKMIESSCKNFMPIQTLNLDLKHNIFCLGENFDFWLLEVDIVPCRLDFFVREYFPLITWNNLNKDYHVISCENHILQKLKIRSIMIRWYYVHDFFTD